MAIYVNPTFGAGNVTLKPVEYGSYGHFRFVASTGATVSLTAGDPILSWRWTSTAANAILCRLSVTSNISGNVTTTVNYDLAATKATSWTASDSAGTAIASPSKGYTTKMGASQLGDARISTTGKLTAGTRTLDTNAFGFVNLPMQGPIATNVGACTVPLDMYKWDMSSEHPLLFVANEGFIVTTPVAANTSGSVRHTFTVDWIEVPIGSATTTPTF